MLSKEKVIERALLTLGGSFKVNDNSNRYRELLNKIFDDIVDEIAHNRDFGFNTKEDTLNYFNTEDRNEDGEYKYNKPVGLLNLVYPTNLRVEGQYIFSKQKKQKIRYNQILKVEELPDYLFNYLRFSLCYELALIKPEFRKRTEEFQVAVYEERSKILSNESVQTRNILDEILSDY